MHRPFDPRFWVVKPGGGLRIKEDMVPEALRIMVRSGAVAVRQEVGPLVRHREGAYPTAVSVDPGAGISPHSLELLSEYDGVCVAAERIVIG